MTKTKLIALFAATLLFVFCLFGCKNPENIKPESDENLPEIIIGSDEYRPFFYADENGTFQGIDVALATEAFKRMGYKAVFRQIRWSLKDELLKEGTINCLWGSFSMDGRLDDYQWSGPYLISRQSVLVLKNSPIQKIEDLAGKSVAVQATSKPDEYFTDRKKDGSLPIKYLYCFTNIENVFASLRKGYVDAVAGHRSMLSIFIGRYPDLNYRFLDENIATVNLGVAFLKGTNAELSASLDSTLDEMLRDGTVSRILGDYKAEDLLTEAIL